jgi:hypothetical protein
MKRHIVEYMSLCDTCQQVKAEHQRPARLLQPLKIPEWKWEEIRMDLIVGLPCTQAGYDSIWVIVDRLTNVAHFIPVKTTYSGAKLAELYMSRIVCLHGVLVAGQNPPGSSVSTTRGAGKPTLPPIEPRDL